MIRNKPVQPPLLAERFLDWYCDHAYLEDLKGDLYEYFERRLEASGAFYARMMFVIDVLRNCKPFLFRSGGHYQQNNLTMLFNHLKSIRRNLARHKFHASINVIGLALGMTGALFIWEYIQHETHYERFHENRSRIFRITSEYVGENGFEVHWARTPQDWVDDLIEELPEVKAQIRFQNYYPRIVKVGEKSFKEEHGFSVDSNVFDVFSFRLLAGDTQQALKAPFSVVLTERLSQKYFGSANPIGEVIQILNEADSSLENYQVTGVMANLPSNTHLPVNFLTSFRGPDERKGWAYNYLLLTGETPIEAVRAKIPGLVEKYWERDGDPGQLMFHLQALGEIHLYSHKAREILPPGNIFYVQIFGIAGLFILAMAIINFMNLSLSKSLDRTREVGIRKALGSRRSTLFGYYLLESMVYSLLAALLAALLITLLTPFFEQISGVEMRGTEMIFPLLVAALATGLISGLYPASILAQFGVISALKGTTEINRGRRFPLRQLLVGIQFIISLIILSSTLITSAQFEFLSAKNLGMETEQVLAITNSPIEVQDKYGDFRQELLRIPGIKAVTATMEVPSREIRDTGTIYFEGEDTGVIMDIQPMDSNYLEVMGIQLLAGGNFTQGILSQQPPPYETVEKTTQYLQEARREYIINETAMKKLGINDPADALNREMVWQGYYRLQPGKIVGITEDYHQETLQNSVDPMVMIYEPIWLRTYLVRLESGNLQHSLQQVDDVWKEMFPNYPMESAFLDEMFDKLYRSEEQQKAILSLFSSLTLIIALLGLVGLLSFMLQRRIKELAIRKILGASRESVILLFGRQFVVQALVALCIAAPATFWFMRDWLDNFAYRISISGLEFFLSFALLLVVLGLTLVLQVGRSAGLNPVETLRQE